MVKHIKIRAAHQLLQHIGTLAVNTLAGQTLVSEDNDKVYAYMTNPETNNNTAAIYTISTGTWTFFYKI